MALLRQENVIARLRLGNNKYRAVTFTAAGALTFPAGMVVGQLTATGKYVPYNTAGAAGEQFAQGVLPNEYTSAGAGDIELQILVKGGVRQDQLTAWNAGTPIALTDVEVTKLQDFGIYAEPDIELDKQDN